jgi:hypothetical protein
VRQSASLARSASTATCTPYLRRPRSPPMSACVPHGAELLGEVVQYEGIFLLCYVRGPAGIIVALAEQIG